MGFSKTLEWTSLTPLRCCRDVDLFCQRSKLRLPLPHSQLYRNMLTASALTSKWPCQDLYNPHKSYKSWVSLFSVRIHSVYLTGLWLTVKVWDASTLWKCPVSAFKHNEANAKWYLTTFSVICGRMSSNGTFVYDRVNYQDYTYVNA